MDPNAHKPKMRDEASSRRVGACPYVALDGELPALLNNHKMGQSLDYYESERRTVLYSHRVVQHKNTDKIEQTAVGNQTITLLGSDIRGLDSG